MIILLLGSFERTLSMAIRRRSIVSLVILVLYGDRYTLMRWTGCVFIKTEAQATPVLRVLIALHRERLVATKAPPLRSILVCVTCHP